jgi:hypothetical protein
MCDAVVVDRVGAHAQRARVSSVVNVPADLRSALAKTMHRTYVSQWLDEPGDMLAGLKPVEAIKRGQLDLVWQVAEGLRSGSQL